MNPFRNTYDTFEILARVYHHETRILGRSPSRKLGSIGRDELNLNQDEINYIISRARSTVHRDLRVQYQAETKHTNVKRQTSTKLPTTFTYRYGQRNQRYILRPL